MKSNVQRFSWAQTTNRSIANTAKWAYGFFNDSYIEKFILPETPTTSTFCPNCLATGKIWHANGQWEWDYRDPDVLKCKVCNMKFPNAAYPESIVYRSNWDPNQTFSYVNTVPQKCMSYEGCRPSINSLIRCYKLHHAIQKMNNIAYGYVVTQKPEYAIVVKKALLRLAKFMPKYLVISGYSYCEICDEDPHVVVKDPSKCSRKITAKGITSGGLFDKYWAGSRLGTSGMDGTYVRYLAESYDLTADAKDYDGKPIYSKEEKANIEKNCLVESALLGYYDTLINNKAVGNREGCALVGLTVGNPILARFGLDGFKQTVSDWFLPDGGTSESASYGFMTMNGIYSLGFAFRDYSDPSSFSIPSGEVRYKHFNVNTDTNFDEAWQALLWTVRENYLYPSIADSYNTTSLDVKYIDYLKMAYNTTTVNNIYNDLNKLRSSPSKDALFYIDFPDNETLDNGSFEYPDVVFPYLSQGYFRSGPLGRKSTVVLDASNYGNHHHYDSLNLVYYKDGYEILHDLGYLWDHVNKSQTVKTRAHNTVLIDGTNQITNNRNGSFSLYSSRGNVKVMQAASNAYQKASVYNRTVIKIEHKSQKDYLVDIFRANGGKRREYVFHGPNNNYSINQELTYNHTYHTDTYRGCVRLYFYTKTRDPYFVISNAVLRPKFINGSYGANMLQEPKQEDFVKKCNGTGTWCYYVGGGSCQITVDNNGYQGSKAVTFVGTSNTSSGYYNVALNLGNVDGYKGKNGLNFTEGVEYVLDCYIKGNLMPSSHIQYWPNGEENNSSKRQYSGNGARPTISENEFTKVQITYIIGSVNTQLGAELSDDLQLTWNVTDNYTFRYFSPRRKINGKTQKQYVFFQDGWGQRLHTNLDYGATLPYFFIYRGNEDNISTFVNVYEANEKDQEIVKRVSLVDKNNGNVAIKIETKEGTDYVLSSFNGEDVKEFGLSTNANVAIQIGEEENQDLSTTPMLINGEYFNTSKKNLNNGHYTYEGNVITNYNDGPNSWFIIENTNNNITFRDIDLNGSCIHVIGECNNVSNIERAYPIRKYQLISENKLKLFTRVDSEGFRTHCHTSWRIPYVKTFSYSHQLTVEPEDENSSKVSLILFIVIPILVICIIAVVVVFIILKTKASDKNSEEEDKEEIAAP